MRSGSGYIVQLTDGESIKAAANQAADYNSYISTDNVYVYAHSMG